MKLEMIFAAISLVFFFGISESFAQGSIISFDIDEKSFAPGKIVELTGNVEQSLAGQPVAIEVKDSAGNVILIRSVTPDDNGNFALKFKIPLTAKAGTFEIVTNVEVAGEAFTETKTVGGSTEDESVCGEGTVMKDGKCVAAETGGGCLIATATFGSELTPQVQKLREIRDNSLVLTKSGSSFMIGFNQIYYSFSPTIADWERENPIFKETVKLTITPLLTSLSILNLVDIDSEEQVLGYGIGIILLNVGMYFVAPTIAIMMLKRKL